MNLTPTRILLIEDNPGDARLLKETLGEQKEPLYLLERAPNLREGLGRLSRGNLDLVLLDLFLPDSSGVSTLESALKAANQVPIIVLTGLNNTETAMKSLKEGAQDFLVKDNLSREVLTRSISYSIERYRLHKKLQEDEERYYLVAQGSHDGLWDWDLQSDRIYFSPRWKLMLGYADGEIGWDPSEWLNRIHPGDLEKVKRDLSDHLSGKSSHFSNEHRLQHKDGRYRWVLGRGLAIHSGRDMPTRIAGSFTDITRHKEMEKKLALRAFYDPLTGLPNRALFMDCLGRAFARLERHPHNIFSVFFLDLDHLKQINDHIGHQAGDELLIEFARRVKSTVRPNDLVARMAGDEFTVLLEDIKDIQETKEVAERILETMRIPFLLGGQEVVSTVSIGIAYSDCGKEDPDGLLKAADSAMYLAKEAGKARYEVFGQPKNPGEPPANS